MTAAIAALVAHARDTPAAARHELALRLGAALPPGAVLLETCHRVELYADPETVHSARPPGVAVLTGEAAARHVVALAVGRASTVLAEDQILHQLRVAVANARARGPLEPALDRLLDTALRAGRRARSWLPGRRPSLADVALDAGLLRSGPRDGSILVVGAGEMGGLAAHAAVRRGRRVVVTSRSERRSVRLAAAVGGAIIPFDPSPGDLEGLAGAVVALSGPWPLHPDAALTLVESGAWVVDLSAPSALDPVVAVALGPGFVSVDDLANEGTSTVSAGLAARLDLLVEETVAAYARWEERAPERAAARALADRAEAAQAAELAALWQRIPGLEPEARAEVERMAERLAARLLRDPLERLRQDEDGRHRQAARELFGL